MTANRGISRRFVLPTLLAAPLQVVDHQITVSLGRQKDGRTQNDSNFIDQHIDLQIAVRRLDQQKVVLNRRRHSVKRESPEGVVSVDPAIAKKRTLASERSTLCQKTHCVGKRLPDQTGAFLKAMHSEGSNKAYIRMKMPLPGASACVLYLSWS